MKREDFIIKTIKKLVTNKYPWVKDVNLNVGMERSTSMCNPHDMYFYYRILINHMPREYSQEDFTEIVTKIYNLKPFVFKQNEFIRAVETRLFPHVFVSP
jgi:hypothetical protein